MNSVWQTLLLLESSRIWTITARSRQVTSISVMQVISVLWSESTGYPFFSISGILPDIKFYIQVSGLLEIQPARELRPNILAFTVQISGIQNIIFKSEDFFPGIQATGYPVWDQILDFYCSIFSRYPADWLSWIQPSTKAGYRCPNIRLR